MHGAVRLMRTLETTEGELRCLGSPDMLATLHPFGLRLEFSAAWNCVALGIGLDKSYCQRSKLSRAKCQLQRRVFEPSSRAQLESIQDYLKSKSLRAKAG